jgi:hypothetical protein
MQVNLANYIRQDVRVPISQGLLPVFEAVSNSLDAIADRGKGAGTIRVTIVRHPEQLDGALGAPKDFIIEDDGVGFSDENLDSFCEAFSDKKLSIGGKGRGRFTYLKVFESATIRSRFKAPDGRTFGRDFLFDMRFSGRSSVPELEASGSSGTTVKLQNMSEQYANAVPRNRDTILRRFVWHFLPRLVSDDSPDIRIVDGTETSLARHLREDLQIDLTHEEFEVGRRTFSIDHLRFKPVGGVKHRFILAASGREVADGFHLLKHLPILSAAPLPMQESDAGFMYVSLVQGSYLDETVDPLRLGFNSGEEPAPQFTDGNSVEHEAADLLGDPQSIGQVRAAALTRVKNFLEPFLKDALSKRVLAIDQYIRRDGMGYHFLRSDIDDVAKGIRSIDDSSIEAELHDRAYREKKKRRSDVQSLLSATPEQKSEEGYFERWQSIVEGMTDIAKSELAAYVAHRRAIIDLMNDRLRTGDDGKHSKEEAIHSVVFPRGKQSGQVGYEQQNLWLIDERLAFHEHLFSDLSVKRITRGESDSARRPDIAIFESGYASFHDGGTPPANLVLVELKRAARKDASRDDPVQAALDYVEALKAGRAYSEGNAVIDVDANAFTTVYILADFTADFRKYLSGRDFKVLPGGDAFTWFHSTASIMFVAMSYRRMIDSAEMRNRIFFRKLGIV